MRYGKPNKVAAKVLCFLSFFAVSIPGQMEPKKECERKTAYLLETVDPSDDEAIRRAVRNYGETLAKEGPQSDGYIRAFGGRKSYFGEIDDIWETATTALREIVQAPRNRFLLVSDLRSYRETPELEFWIRPEPCSTIPANENGLSFEEIEFREAPASETLFLTNPQMLERLREQPAIVTRSHLKGRIQIPLHMIFDSMGRVIFAVSSGDSFFAIYKDREARKLKFDFGNELGTRKFYRGTVVFEIRGEDYREK